MAERVEHVHEIARMTADAVARASSTSLLSPEAAAKAVVDAYLAALAQLKSGRPDAPGDGAACSELDAKLTALGENVTALLARSREISALSAAWIEAVHRAGAGDRP